MSADRPGYIAGLRRLADLLEQHEGIPLPAAGAIYAMAISFLPGHGESWEAARARLDAAKAAIGGEYGYKEHDGRAYHETQAPGVAVSLVMAAAPPARFCAQCGGALPGHSLTCPLIPAGPEHPAGAQAVTP